MTAVYTIAATIGLSAWVCLGPRVAEEFLARGLEREMDKRAKRQAKLKRVKAQLHG